MADATSSAVLLDTSTFLWWVTADARLPARMADHLRDPNVSVALSAASSWEIAIKNALGKLPLPSDAESLIPTLRIDHGIDPLPIGEAAALKVGRLPPLHRDPFDRILVAQSIVHGLTIATSDRQIQAYPCRWMWLT